MSYNVTLPSGITKCIVVSPKTVMYRFGKSGTYTKQVSGCTLSSVTFNASGNNITCTKPSGVDIVHVILACGHYYRFEKDITSLPRQGACCTSYVTGGKTVSIS